MFDLKFIKKLRPILFKYNDKIIPKKDKQYLGIIAQDIVEQLDDESLYSIIEKDANGYYKVDYVQLIAPLIKAVQELSDQVDELKKERTIDNNGDE